MSAPETRDEMVERLPTGITVLDRQLGGGIPEGSIVLLVAPPASQSELFLYELTTTRGTLYLTTVRSGTAVEDAVDRVPGRVGNPTVRDIGGDAPLDNAHSLVRDLPEGANLIVDVMDPLERRDARRYRGFLNELQTHLVNTKGLAVLHALRGSNVPDNRDMTEHMADVVFDLRTSIDGAEIENRLAVPKFRGGSALEETIKLKLTEEVSIDTSRDIA
jgi:KaiC/GvpD/RAD55 family RecA-like ATPase